MSHTFDPYAYVGVIVPGSVLMLGIMWLFPEFVAPIGPADITVGVLGLFIIVAYAAGQLLQGVGNGIEWLWWNLWGGMPSKRVLKSKLPINVSTISTKDMRAVVREVYASVAAAEMADRVDIFNGNYGLLRGIAAALIVLVVVALVLGKGFFIIGSLIVLLALELQRMHRFGNYYAQELFIQYLLLAGKPSELEK